MKKFILFNLCLLFLIPSLVCGEDPLETFNIKTPNVMIVFDTSCSMDLSPDGQDVDDSNVRVDDEGNIVTSGGTKYHFAGGGNHPNSRLYQAKLALKKVIKDIVKDKVNLGFTTYAQFKQQQILGYYKRDVRYWVPTVPAVPDKWKCCRARDEWQCCRTTTTPETCNSRSESHSGGSQTVSPCSASCPGGWSESHTFESSCTSSYTGSLSFSLSGSNCNTEYNRKTCNYQSASHTDYYTSGGGTSTQCQIYTSNPGSCSSYCWGYDSCSGPTLIPGVQDCMFYFSNPGNCNAYCAGYSSCTGPTFFQGSPEIPGHWGSWETQYDWITMNDLSCPATYGSAGGTSSMQWTIWTRVDPPKCYDVSDYVYPADGTTNKPHTWSYFKMQGGNWPENIQMDNYYPSVDGSGNFNDTPGAFNNHHFFINFPDDKDPTFTPAIRTAIKEKVLSLMDVTPVKFPSGSGGLPGDWEFDEYYTKVPVHSNADPPRTGLTSNTQFAKFTPLADSLKYSFKYFYDYIYNYKGGDPASKIITTEGILCRGNFVILLTDGLESARFLDAQQQQPDYAAAPREAANLLTINVRTFVIGFGTDIVGNQTLNDIARAGGTEQAYYAPDYAGLQDALLKIFRAILSTTYARSNPVVTRERDRIYRAYFTITPEEYYKGHLEARNIDGNGDIINPQPLAPVWDAGLVMSSQGRGNVYTWTASGPYPPYPTRLVFEQSNSSLYPLVNPSSEDINGDGSVNSTDAQTVINFTLNPGYDGGKYKGKRAPDWKLGDIFHSTPVVIGAPAFLFTEDNYQTFYNNNKNREKMIYAGANDGMLHGFRNSDGKEIFSIIPKNLLGRLKNLKSIHDFYVDSSLKAYDVYFRGAPLGPAWKTILISGQMSGGPYYFAVDVTVPDNPQILWEWTDTNMGDSWGKPDIGKVNVGGTKKFVAFFTGGYSTTNDRGNRFYVVDIETGATIKKFTVGDARNKIPSGPKTFDSNGDGLVDYVYFGDIKGTIWKVDVSNPSTTAWTLSSLYTPNPDSKRKPIFYSPEVTKNDEGRILVYFGTGEELNLTAVPVTNYFWEIWDDNGNGKLIPQANWPKVISNQKVLASPFMVNRVIFFTAWEYPGPSGIQQDLCGVGLGHLYGYKMSMTGAPGGQAGLVTLDAGGNPKTQESLTLGIGIPSAPIITNGRIYTSSSVNSQDIFVIRTPLWDTTGNIRAWREIF